MLNTLRITSRCIAIFSVLAAAVICFMLQTNNRQIESYLRQIGGVDDCSVPTQTNSAELPLVASALEFANRINPPIKIVKGEVTRVEKKGIERNPISQKEEEKMMSACVFIQPRYELWGTVVYENYPRKSLALLKTKYKYEWLKVGEYMSHHRIAEITSRNMVIINGGKKETLSMPARPKLVLLKDA